MKEEIHKVSRFIQTVVATTCHYRKLLANSSLRKDSLLRGLERHSRVKFTRWSPPTLEQKFKVNTHASLSEQHIFLGYALFDHRGVHLLRRAKVIKMENHLYPIGKAGAKNDENPDVVIMAEARALELALVELKERGWLPGVVQLGCFSLFQKLLGISPLYTVTSKELRDIIESCKHIIDEKHIQVNWAPRQVNAIAKSLVESAKKDKKDMFNTDIDLKLCHITWGQMFGPFKPYLSNTTTTSEVRQKYLLSNKDGVTQKILSWINMALSKKRIPKQIAFEISTKNGVRFLERYAMSLTSVDKKVSDAIPEDQILHRLIDIFDHLQPIPVPRTLLMYLQFDTEIELLPNDLFRSCSPEEYMIKSHLRYFVYFLGRMQFGSLAVTLRALSYYAPGICIRRHKFGPRKNYRGKDIRSTILGWLHLRTIDDFQIIDILNEVECKSVENIEVTLKELVQKGILIEMKPDLYIIQRKQLPQPSQNDFSVEVLEDERKKEGEFIAYYYKVAEGIDL